MLILERFTPAHDENRLGKESRFILQLEEELVLFLFKFNSSFRLNLN